MYCSKCGQEIRDEAIICPHCGCATGNRLNNNNARQESDSSSGGWLALGLFFPLIGFILYLVWKDEFPLRANSVGKGALIGVIISVGIGVLTAILTIMGVGCAACMAFPPYYY